MDLPPPPFSPLKQYNQEEVKEWYKEIESISLKDFNFNNNLVLPSSDLALSDSTVSDDEHSISTIRVHFNNHMNTFQENLRLVQNISISLTSKLMAKLCAADLNKKLIKEMEADINDAQLTNASLASKVQQMRDELNLMKARLREYESNPNVVSENRSTAAANSAVQSDALSSTASVANSVEEQRETLKKVAEIFGDPLDAAKSTSRERVPLKSSQTPTRVATLCKKFGNGSGTRSPSRRRPKVTPIANFKALHRKPFIQQVAILAANPPKISSAIVGSSSRLNTPMPESSPASTNDEIFLDRRSKSFGSFYQQRLADVVHKVAEHK